MPSIDLITIPPVITKAKYAQGDVLVLEGSTTGETFLVLSVVGTQYILRSSQGGTASFYIDIALVDNNPMWRLASATQDLTKYLMIGGGILLLAFVLSRK